jgi:hypothetical protein
LNYALIITFALPGAVVATATVLSGINTNRVVEVWYYEGMLLYDKSYLKPLLARGISAVLLHLVPIFLSGYMLLVLGSFMGSVGFVSTLLLLGMGSENKEILQEFVPAK